MTTISSTSAYSVSSLYNTKKTSSSSGGLDLDDSSSNGSRKSVFTADWDEAGSSASSSASLKLSSQLWDLMSSEDTQRDSVESQGFTTGTDSAASDGSTESEFLNLSNKTLAERIRQQYLDDNNLSEDDLKTMNADERAKIEDQIRQQVQAAMKELQNIGSSTTADASSTSTSETQQV